MDTTAIKIIEGAYELCNRLSPGEELGGDDLDRSFDALNLIVDAMSARTHFLFKPLITTVTQTGHITLATGSWAAIPKGTEIVSVKAEGLMISQVSYEQYNSIYDNTQTGAPGVYAYNNFDTVKLFPVASAHEIAIQTRAGVTTFADLETTYTFKPGYASMLIAKLAVRKAPSIIGKLPAELLRAEAADTVIDLDPKVLNVYGYGKAVGGNILSG